MRTKISKVKLIWALYGLFAVCLSVSAVSVRSVYAFDVDACTQNECDAGVGAAYAACAALGQSFIYSTYKCLSPDVPQGMYGYQCWDGTYLHPHTAFCD